MEKLLLLMILSCMSYLVLACGNNQPSTTATGNEPSKEPAPKMQLEGYVVEKASGTVLVVNPHPKVENKYVGPAYFSNTPDTIEIGDKVIISFDMMMESYPGQAEAGDVKVLDSHKPNGADLTEAQVLNKALSNIQLKTPILTKFQYNKETDTWSIQVGNIMEEKEDITIEDK